MRAYDLDRRAFIRERCDAIIAKLLAGGNEAVTAVDYRGLATDALWLLDSLDGAEAAVRSKHAVMEAALRLEKTPSSKGGDSA